MFGPREKKRQALGPGKTSTLIQDENNMNYVLSIIYNLERPYSERRMHKVSVPTLKHTLRVV